MKTENLEQQLLLTTKGLAKEELQEIIDFADFIRQKKMKKAPDNLSKELSSLDEQEIQHLEDEFTDYKNLFPHE
jgi:hypothetical protein